MHILILTTGTWGDVQPYVALGAGLEAAGHTTSIAAHATYESFIRGRGLGFAPLVGDIRELMQTDEALAVMDGRANPLRFIRVMARAAAPLVEQGLRDVLRACQEPDVIVASKLAFYVCYYIAQKRHVPLYLAFLQPLTPTRAVHNPLFPAAPAWLAVGSGAYNLLSHHIAAHLFWQFGRPLLNKAWQQVLDEPKLPFWGPVAAEAKQRVPVLYGYSSAVIPKPADWGDHQHITGYWFLDPEPGWQPPPELVDFLRSGPPPVYVGFGSVNSRDAAQHTDVVLQALQRSKKRAVLTAGWGGLSQADMPDHVFMIDSIPHAWLFPRVAVAVHHGGAGTTAAALRSGIPSVTVPFTGEQLFWGDRVQRLGAGPAPIPRSQLTPARLAAAIDTAVCNEAIRRTAAALGRQIQLENGVARAVELISRGCAYE